MDSLPADVERAIRLRLGDEARARVAEVSSGKYQAFEAPARLDMLDEIARDAGRFGAMRTRLFLTLGSTRLVAIYGMPIVDVIEYARVGTHNGEDQDFRAVKAVVADVAHDGPLEIVFADEAGLDIRFVGDVAAERARRYDALLLDLLEGDPRWIDSYTSMVDEATRAGIQPDEKADPRGGGLVSAWIVAKRTLRFWWD